MSLASLEGDNEIKVVYFQEPSAREIRNKLMEILEGDLELKDTKTDQFF